MRDVAARPPNGSMDGRLAAEAERAEEAAARAGVDAVTVERLPFDLSVLEADGVFLNVDASGFGMLDRRLDWEALGVTLPRGCDVAFRPPRCGLLPDRYRLPLLRPAAQAHAALHHYSYRFTLVETLFETSAYRWVPWRAFETFEASFRAAQGALDAAKAAVLEVYEGAREEVVEGFLQLATDSARRLEATGHFVPDGFQDAVVRGVLNAMPTPQDLQERLVLRYRVGVLLLSSEMLAEQRRATEERQHVAVAEAELRLSRQREQAAERVVQTELWAEEERIRRRLKAEEDERLREAAIKERLHQLRVEAAKERLQETMSPIEEGARQIHAAVYEAASAIRASLEKHGRLHGASAKKARDLARWFRLMQWQSDQELETLLAELEALMRQPAGRRKRDPGPIDEVLGDLVGLCYAGARSLTEGPHRMGALEL